MEPYTLMSIRFHVVPWVNEVLVVLLSFLYSQQLVFGGSFGHHTVELWFKLCPCVNLMLPLFKASCPHCVACVWGKPNLPMCHVWHPGYICCHCSYPINGLMRCSGYFLLFSCESRRSIIFHRQIVRLTPDMFGEVLQRSCQRGTPNVKHPSLKFKPL